MLIGDLPLEQVLDACCSQTSLAAAFVPVPSVVTPTAVMPGNFSIQVTLEDTYNEAIPEWNLLIVEQTAGW